MAADWDKPNVLTDSQRNYVGPASMLAGTDTAAYRDPRLDFYRGLALLMIFIDHIESVYDVRLISVVTLQSLLVCDAADVFVFISGIVCARAYGRVFDECGYLACQRKAIRRAGVLYTANLVTLMVVIEFVVLAGLPMDQTFHGLALHGLERSPWETAAASLALLYQPLGFDILTLYIEFVLILPVFLLLESGHRGSGIVVAAVLYVFAQFAPQINLPKYPAFLHEGWGTSRFFNHLAWPFLFLLAAFCSRCHVRDRVLGTIGQRILCAGALFALTGNFLFEAILQNLPERGPLQGVYDAYTDLRSSWWCTKGTLGPLRLVMFLLLANIAASLIPRHSSAWRSHWFDYISACGRVPLVLFCINLVLTYGAWPVVRAFGRSTLVIVGYESFGCALMIVLAQFLERRPRRTIQITMPVHEQLNISDSPDRVSACSSQ